MKLDRRRRFLALAAAARRSWVGAALGSVGATPGPGWSGHKASRRPRGRRRWALPASAPWIATARTSWFSRSRVGGMAGAPHDPEGTRQSLSPVVPGAFCWSLWTSLGGRVLREPEAARGRHCCGHGSFSRDGRRLLHHGERQRSRSSGRRGVRDVEGDYRQVATLAAPRRTAQPRHRPARGLLARQGRPHPDRRQRRHTDAGRRPDGPSSTWTPWSRRWCISTAATAGFWRSIGWRHNGTS